MIVSNIINSYHNTALFVEKYKPPEVKKSNSIFRDKKQTPKANSHLGTKVDIRV